MSTPVLIIFAISVKSEGGRELCVPDPQDKKEEMKKSEEGWPSLP